MAKSVNNKSDQKPSFSVALATEPNETPIATLTRDPDLSCRVKGQNPKVIGEYASGMASGRVFPPVTAFRDPEGVLWLADGFHRVAAAELAGRATISADVREGSRLDAMTFAAGANTGLRRTTADKRQAVRMLLAARPDWSDVRVAEAAAVTDKTVAAERKRANLGNSEVTRTGKDGKARKPPKRGRGRPKAPRVVRALRPLAKVLDRIGRSHPEAEAEVQRATAALLDLVAKLSPDSVSQPGLTDTDAEIGGVP